MGMEHERIHIETSSVLIRQLPVDMVQKPKGFVYGPVKGTTDVLLILCSSSVAIISYLIILPYFGIYHSKALMAKTAIIINLFVYTGPFSVKENSMLTVPAQDVVLGKPCDFPSYGWDNEYGQRHCK